jgi:hypothetical protein
MELASKCEKDVFCMERTQGFIANKGVGRFWVQKRTVF